MTTSNEWCRTLGIEVPRLESVATHREANTYSLLLVALLERGEPMTLVEVAARFAAAGVADEWQALRSLSRCKPGRPPVYRDGDRYSLDPHDHDLDLWMFRLGLRPPRVARTERPPAPPPMPSPNVPLTEEELDEAWRDASLTGWSAQRLALAVLDAAGGPSSPTQVAAAVSARTRWHGLREDSAKFKRRGSAIAVLEDGRWAIANDATDAITQTRAAVRGRIAMSRRWASMRTDPATARTLQAEAERRRTAHGEQLAGMSRALLVAYPPARPQAVVLLDVTEQELSTFVGDELARLRARLDAYDIVGAIDVRSLLRALDIDPESRRLAELGPPQKTMKLNKRGRTLKITTTVLVQGSCGIGKPFGDPPSSPPTSPPATSRSCGGVSRPTPSPSSPSTNTGDCTAPCACAGASSTSASPRRGSTATNRRSTTSRSRHSRWASPSRSSSATHPDGATPGHDGSSRT